MKRLITDGFMLALYIATIYYLFGKPDDFPFIGLVVAITTLRILDFIFIRLIWDNKK